MLYKYGTKKKVEECLLKIKLEGKLKVYPNEIKNRTYLSMTEVLVSLNKIIEEGKIELRYEVKCNVCKQVSTNTNGDNICTICGEQMNVDYNKFIPVYYIK